MSYSNTKWATLEQWSPVIFLIAGGLFVLLAAAYGFRAATGAEPAVSPTIIFVCLLVVFVGLLGLYPRLAEGNATLALGGVGLLAVTAAIILSILGLSTLPVGPTVGKQTIVASIMSVVVGSTLTLTTFGVASLRTGGHLRPVGGSLLMMAASLLFIVVAMLLFSNPTPAWVGFVASGLFVISSVSIGYVLRTEDVPANHAESTDDVTAN
jgi:FtsH-binding integral membrane protein